MRRYLPAASDVSPARLPMGTGNEWVIDAFGCDAARLKSLAEMATICEAVIEYLQLKVVRDAQWHRFPEPGGVTGLYLLSESHLACHTYPEHSLATFNLYCCRPREPWPWGEELRRRLLASDVVVQIIPRGRANDSGRDRGGNGA